MKNSKYEIDMCNGPLFSKIVIFSIPLILSGVLQLLYNAADVIVVGRYAGSTALAAVGSTGALTNLIVSIFMGLSVGTSVVIAQYYGAEEWENVGHVVHTAIATSIISGLLLGVTGVVMAKTLLTAMDTPGDVLGQSTLYMRIYFAGMPASIVYNFGSAILRAVGDTKRPLIFLTISGIVNVVLNLIFVIVFGMGVAGVAVATIISQAISAVLVIKCLMQFDGPCRLILKDIKIHWNMFVKIMKIGLPAGLQGSIFSISNVLIQSSVNSFGSVVMAGNSASANIEGFIYVSMNAIYSAALTFTGQNAGAKKYKRIKSILGICILIVTAVGTGLGLLAVVFGKTLLGIYAPGNAEVIGYGLIRLSIIAGTYFICGLMDVLGGMLRGIGKSFVPMLISIFGVCGIRIAWIYTIFAQHRDLKTLYISYPVSWTITAVAQFIGFLIVSRRMAHDNAESPQIEKASLFI